MALDVVAFLDEIIQTIWDIHGIQMGLYLERPSQPTVEASVSAQRLPSTSTVDDDLLF